LGLQIFTASAPQLLNKLSQPQQVFDPQPRSVGRNDHERIRFHEVSEGQGNHGQSSVRGVEVDEAMTLLWRAAGSLEFLTGQRMKGMDYMKESSSA
jgi:hypothetical protein